MKQKRELNHHITDAVWKGMGIWLLIAAICLIWAVLEGCKVTKTVEHKTETKTEIKKNQ